ncbi:hypothetical protein Ancab_015254 [Ancistrocladus abbreviatus]
MVGIMAVNSRERMASLIDSVEYATNVRSKLEHLGKLKEELSHSDTVLLSEFLSGILKLHADRFSPVRKFVIEMIAQIGSRYLEFLPEIVPVLMIVVEDDTPAVARQAISSGTHMFCCTLEKVAIQGLHTSELDDSLESAWAWMLKLKERIYSIAFQPGSDGRRLLALKFIEAVILVYTPDPNGTVEPPPQPVAEGWNLVEFNISWIRRGHPVLKVGDLSVEASQSLGLLLDQLRFPTVRSQSTSMVIILINCLSAIARRRPSFYGRILPVLLGLDPSHSAVKTAHVYGVQHALKNSFVLCLQCTHPSATPWRDRLIGALRGMKAGGLADQVLDDVFKINGTVKEEMESSDIIKDVETPTEVCIQLHNNVGRKRSGDEESGERSGDDDALAKRSRTVPVGSEKSAELSNTDLGGVDGRNNLSGKATSEAEGGSEAVQHLLAVFGPLVAQGEKAVGTLEILISGISAGLLAEVVIANMRYLPSTCPKAEGDEELSTNIGRHPDSVDSDTRFRELSSFLANAFSSSTASQMSSSMDGQVPASDFECEDIGGKEPQEMAGADDDVLCAATTKETEEKVLSSDVPYTSVGDGHSEVSRGYSAPITSEFEDVGIVDSVIPGLDGSHGGGLRDASIASTMPDTDVDNGCQDQVGSFGRRPQLDSLPSTSTDRSEELSPKPVTTDANSGSTPTEAFFGSIQQFVLPKISAPVVDLSDEQKDLLQKFAFMRIIESYKQVAVAGGSQLRFSLLAYLGVEFPLELDPWTLIQNHILSDYINNEGHELTLRALYRLYGEAEEDRDFFSSTTATSVYDMFLLKVAEMLRDSFPASDKSLSRLLGEVPYLPTSIFKLLEALCSPENSVKEEKESHVGDRVTQGLSAVWSLILLRPPLRDVLLKIALQSAVHHLEEVRMKAIRLVANKLYPLSSIALKIEEFANEMLLSVAKDVGNAAASDAAKSANQLQKNSDTEISSNEQPSASAMTKDHSDSVPSSTSGTISSTSISEARRCMSLYFALCTKKHSLLQQIFVIYDSSPDSVKQAVHSHVPILIRTIGASSVLLEILSDPPDGSDDLVMQVVSTLTDGAIPPPELIFTIKNLYVSKGKDVEILFPILSFLPKEEVLPVFPRLVNLPTDKFQIALGRLLQGSVPSGPVLTPGEVLIAIHGIDPDKDAIPLKKVTDACNVCFEQRQIFTQQVIANVLNHLVVQIPLPLLFMRTVLQAIGAFPTLVEFIMGILSRLVSKQIWKYPKLWVGFLKCALLTQPHSFSVLLQLPAAQLENALTKTSALKPPLVAYANQPNVRSTLPRSILAVLGIASDSQPPTQPQAAQQEVEDASSSAKVVVTEKSKETSETS